MTFALNIMSEQQQEKFMKNGEADLAYGTPDGSRYRVNLFRQRGDTGMVLRIIPAKIPPFDNLNVPGRVRELTKEHRGLVLVTGVTGSGKSTTLAAMIDHRNTTMRGHIITVEDPIEFLHPHKKSVVDQREVGIDTISYEVALKNALRAAPDLIMVGEVREAETMEHALHFAETGHLCVSTLHANNANQALERIVNFFPEERRPQLLMDLSLNLLGIMSQRLIPTAEGGRCAAIEVLLASPLVKDLILQGDIHALKDIMEKSIDQGMKTFDQALFSLYHEGKITQEEAMRNADSANNLRLKIKLASEGGAGGVGGLSLEETD